MNPGTGTSTCSTDNGSDGGDGSGGGGSSGGSSGGGSSGKESASKRDDIRNSVDDYYDHSHHMHHRLERRNYDYFGKSISDINTLWRDISGTDVSGTDISGNRISMNYNFKLSLSDLLSLVGKTIIYGDSLWYNNNSVESRYQRRLEQMREELKYPYYYDYEEYFQNCNSPSNAQANDYIQRKKGINMDDYIRKDSIPCYGCTLP